MARLAMSSAGLTGVEGPRLNAAINFTPAEYQAYLKISRGRYFKLRLRGVDIAASCQRCGAGGPGTKSHEYFTLMCVERPWKGNWMDALWAYSSVTRDAGQSQAIIRGLRDLSQKHPETARELASNDAQDVIAWALATEVVIDEREALLLTQLINERGSMGFAWEPFVLE